MADHVSISEVHHHNIERVVVDRLHHSIGNSLRRHLWLQVISRNLGRRYQDTIFSGKRLLHPTVKEVCDMGILLRLGDAQVAHLEVRHHISQDVTQCHGRRNDR